MRLPSRTKEEKFRFYFLYNPLQLKEISWFFEDTQWAGFQKDNIFNWLNTSLLDLNRAEYSINYIICSDDYLLDVNKQYLNHDYYTDIITFNNSDDEGVIETDIFISLDRVKDNANTQNVELIQEFCRVSIHGLLHLCGYDDKTDELKKEMRVMEDKYLALLPDFLD